MTCSDYRTEEYSSLDDATRECHFDDTCGGITEGNVDYGSGYYLCDYGTFFEYSDSGRVLSLKIYEKGKRYDFLHTFDTV